MAFRLKVGSGSGPKIWFVSYLHFPSLNSFGLRNSGRGQLWVQFSENGMFKNIPVFRNLGNIFGSDNHGTLIPIIPIITVHYIIYRSSQYSRYSSYFFPIFFRITDQFLWVTLSSSSSSSLSIPISLLPSPNHSPT